MRQQDVFASAQILAFNPILKESTEVRTQYFLYLRKLIRLVKWDKRKYTKAQIAFYKKTLCGEDDIPRVSKEPQLPTCICYLIPYDIALMVAFHQKVIHTEKIAIIINKIVSDFNLPPEVVELLHREFDAALGDKEAWHEVFANTAIKGYKQYLKTVQENIFFIRKYPYNILITATMSAGKSTLINTLVGKNVCRMQTTACTSKIHTIISKPFEDDVTSEYDHDLSMDATKEELFTNNEENLSSRISVGTYFNGGLGGQRIVLFDSPGVNSSQNADHCEISRKMIHSKRYNLLIYVLNATQLAIDSEAVHLEFVKSQIGRTKVLFVMNQIDHLISDVDCISDVIENQRKFLISKGFRDPVICPVSSIAAYLAKKSQQEELSRSERRKMEVYIDIFSKNSAASYYEKQLHCPHLPDSTDETKALLRNCGFAYLEQIIKHISNGGKINGSGLC